jgi:hypothetical protein
VKTLVPALLALSIARAAAETFEDITQSFPLGTRKEEIVARVPSAAAVPCALKPIDVTRPTECMVQIRRDAQSALVVQLYLVDDRVAAIFCGRKALPGTSYDSVAETAYLKNARKLGTFRALRTDKELQPVEIEVDQYSLTESRHVALIVASSDASEAWIVDTGIFDPKSFFMEPTAANREKVTKTKEAIEANER